MPLSARSSERFRAARPAAVTAVTAALAALLAVAPAPARAAPFTPSDDRQVLETLATRPGDPLARDLRAWRAQLQRRPDDLETALKLARRAWAQVVAEGDPRYVGVAQAALAHWWDQPAPPAQVRVLRAVLRQFDHGFDAARVDLEAVVAADPAQGEAWSWLAAIALVQARYADARRACEGLAPLASALVATACRAQVDGLTGRGAAAAAALSAALARDLASGEAAPDERLWALTRLAEIEERLGRADAAESAFAQALALDVTDGYLLAARADFLLDRGRTAEVLTLLRGRERSDLLLLRLALAARAAGRPEQAAWSTELGARFDAARRRGDTVHEKEEARWRLAFGLEPARALALARSNFEVQKEPADARVLLEAALATGDTAAAAPVLRWMDASGIESVVLRGLRARLPGGGR